MKRILIVAILLMAGGAWAGEIVARGEIPYDGNWFTLPGLDGKYRIVSGTEQPITYPQLARIPWDEANEFLRSEAREGRRWEYVDFVVVGEGHTFLEYGPNKESGMTTHYVPPDTYVILKREVTE